MTKDQNDTMTNSDHSDTQSFGPFWPFLDCILTVAGSVRSSLVDPGG